MATQAEVEEYSAATQAVVALAVAELASFMASGPQLEEVREFFPELVRSFGRMTASLAADWYDDLRANADVPRGYRARVADPVPVEQALAIVGQSFTPITEWVSDESDDDDSDLDIDDDDALGDEDDAEDETGSGSEFDDEPTRTNPQVAADSDADRDTDTGADEPASGHWVEREPTPDEIQGRLTNKTQRLVMQPARDTITENVERDPAGARWARIPMGDETCAFCLMLASRGAVYRSEESASTVVSRRARNTTKRPEGEAFHDDCNCVATPFWDGDDYPEGYDPETYYDLYEDARNQAPSKGTKDILAKMRELYGLR